MKLGGYHYEIGEFLKHDKNKAQILELHKMPGFYGSKVWKLEKMQNLNQIFKVCLLDQKKTDHCDHSCLTQIYPPSAI